MNAFYIFFLTAFIASAKQYYDNPINPRKVNSVSGAIIYLKMLNVLP